MRVAERGDADARQQIEILAPLGVVQPHALAAHERDRRALVRLQHVSRLERLNFVDGRFVSIALSLNVPNSPIAVQVSTCNPRGVGRHRARRRRLECRPSRPSTITTSSDAAAIACSQARSLAIMPAVAVPSATSRSMAAGRAPAPSSRRAQNAGRGARDVTCSRRGGRPDGPRACRRSRR